MTQFVEGFPPQGYGHGWHARVHSDVSLHRHHRLEKTKAGPPASPIDLGSIRTLKELVRDMTAPTIRADSPEGDDRVVNGLTVVLESTDQMSLLRRIESRFPAREEAGCKVGIGVATGADAAFIGKFEDLDVEPERKLPLVLTDDIQSGELIWRGLGVVNPFSAEDGLVDLADFPRFARYVKARKDVIAARHCARKTPNAWYRTLDRIHPELTTRPKLLIPDIKGSAHIAPTTPGRFIRITISTTFFRMLDLRHCRRPFSAVTKLFITTYSTQMRGGYLRFQYFRASACQWGCPTLRRNCIRHARWRFATSPSNST